MTFKDFYLTTSWADPTEHINVFLFDPVSDDVWSIDFSRSPKLLYFFEDFYINSIEAEDNQLNVTICKENLSLFENYPYLIDEKVQECLVTNHSFM